MVITQGNLSVIILSNYIVMFLYFLNFLGFMLNLNLIFLFRPHKLISPGPHTTMVTLLSVLHKKQLNFINWV